MLPIISIVIPSLNTVKYIEQCLNSVASQTINNFEVICVDAGSTDGTTEIIENFVRRDKRFLLISSNVKSYGYQMNLGIKSAKGKYLGIIEPDDFLDANAFESLVNIAEKNNCDIVKAQWFNYSDNFEYRMNIVPSFIYRRVINPLFSTKHSLVVAYLFDMPAAIWSGIYKLDFLRSKKILFNETPGASFQDTGFYFKTLSLAENCMFIENCYVHYRLDNDSSSVKSESKDFCICDEIQDLEKFLNNSSLNENEKAKHILSRFIYTKYKWNISRMTKNNLEKFNLLFNKKMIQLNECGYLNKKYFDRGDWNDLNNRIYPRSNEKNFKFIVLIKEYLWCLRYGGLKYSLWKTKKWLEGIKHG